MRFLCLVPLVSMMLACAGSVAAEGPPNAPDDPPAGEGDDKPAEPPEPPPPPPKPEPVAADVSVTKPKFMGGGDVPHIDKALAKTREKVASCILEHGGLEGGGGKLDVQFLVRSRGKAEGVEVLAHEGVSDEAARCVRKLLQNRWMGSPSQDPVGVTMSYKLKAKK
jgi:hypothetical protein